MRKDRITDEDTLRQRSIWKGCRRGYIVRCQRRTPLFLRIFLAFIAGLSLLALVESNTALADEYVLIMSKDNKVCQHMLNLYNDDLRKYGEIQYDKHTEFTAVQWIDKMYNVVRSGGVIHKGTMLMSEFNINNDGKKEIVLKFRGSFGGADTESLDIFKEEDKNYFKGIFEMKNIDQRIGRVGPGSIFFGNSDYELKDLPMISVGRIGNVEDVQTHYSMGSLFYFHPFIFENTCYIEMRDDMTPPPPYVKRFLVILKFAGNNTLTDIGYYLKAVQCKNEKEEE